MANNDENRIILNKEGDEVRIDYDDLRSAVLVLRAINHTLRKRMLALLEENGEMTVTDIFVALRIEQSIASQHLSVLRKANIVDTRRDGKFIYYSVNSDRVAYLADVIKTLSI